MARSAVPQLRIHRATGQQYIIVAGRRRYLGRHDAADAAERYARFVAEFTVDGQAPGSEGDDLTIVEVCDRFMIYAAGRYGDHSGEYRGEWNRISRPADRHPLVRQAPGAAITG